MTTVQIISLVALVVLVGLYVMRRRSRLGREDRD
jgi:branched-subunit amino acid ABC-type transport system permease component